jgi:hypothetical protein
MYLHEAIKSALEHGGGMCRRDWPHKHTLLFPTRSPAGIIVSTFPEESRWRLCPQWNPTVDDLLADDWEIPSRSY